MLKLIKRSGRKIAASVMAAGLALANASYFQTVDFSNVYVSAATGEYKTWKQGDPRWSGIRLGSSWETIGQSGCAVTSVAMLLVKSGNFDESTINPGSLCQFLTNNGGLDSSANIYWGAVSKLCPSFTFEGTGLLYGTTAEEKAAEYKSYLDQGYYLVADVKYSCHWVAIDRVEDGVVYSIDPAYGTTNVLFDQYNFKGCTRVKLYRSADQPVKPAEPAASAAYESGSYVTTDALRVRQSATISSETLDILKNNTKIRVSEISGCWGKISENGVSGWVCLNYARKTDDDPVSADIQVEAVVNTKPEFETGEYVTNDVINYRSGSSTAYDSFGLILRGVGLQVTEIVNNWGKTNYNGKDCWICLDYADRTGALSVPSAEAAAPAVSEDTSAETEEENVITEEASAEEVSEETAVSEAEKAVETEETAEPEVSEDTTAQEAESSDVVIEGVPYITTDFLNFRSAPGVTNTIFEVISKYEIVTVKEINDNWGKIEYNGKTGWISLAYAQPVVNTSEENKEAVSENASEDKNAPASVNEEKTEEAVQDIQNAQVSEQKTEETAACNASEENSENADYLKGDVNQDGVVNVLDIVEMAKMLLQLIDKNYTADMNNDGAVNALDLISLRKILLDK